MADYDPYETADPSGVEPLTPLSKFEDIPLDPDAPDGQPDIDPDDHFANLEPLLSAADRTLIEYDLKQSVETGRSARDTWRGIMEKGIKNLGYDRQVDQRSGIWAGASHAVHPVLAKACVDFSSRAMTGLLPSKGIVNAEAPGDQPDEQLVEAADRVGAFCDWQVMEQIEGWEDEHDQMLAMLPLEGQSYIKPWWDAELGRPCVAYIPSDKIILPHDATSPTTAAFVAHEMPESETGYKAKVRRGIWSDHEPGEALVTSEDRVGDASAKVSGSQRQPSVMGSSDKPYMYWEIAARRDLPSLDPGGDTEWLITIEETSAQVVAVRRNWRPTDKRRRRIPLVRTFRLMPWRGAYAIGLLHLIGGLSDASTGALRALLDSAHWQNMPGGWRLKGSKTTGGKTIIRGPGEYPELDAPGVQDIRSIIMNDPHPGPSPVLVNLLQSMVAEAMDFASVANREVSESNQNVPVGTTLARLEESSQIYGSIFRRLVRSLDAEIKDIHEITRDEVTPDLIQEWIADGAPPIAIEDFDARLRIKPAADPEHFSRMQKIMQGQAVIDMLSAAAERGVRVNMRMAFEMALTAMRIGQIDQLMPEVDPFNGQPWAENSMALRQRELEVGPDDDHALHIAMHLALLDLPNVMPTETGQQLFVHICEHAAAQMMIRPEPSAYQAILEKLTNAMSGANPDAGMALAKAEQIKASADTRATQAKIMLDAARLQTDQQRFQAKLDADMQKAVAQMQADIMEHREKAEIDLHVKLAQIEAQKTGVASKERIEAAKMAVAGNAVPEKIPAQKDDVQE